MGISWDYTRLADSYLKRPDYASEAVERIVALARLPKGAAVCDVGAGVAHLTIPLARRGLRVTAVEPNAAMRAHGVKRTADLADVRWQAGTG
ncbi:MAG: methyltransferase, partial [Elusimicrobia bacterium]|nr:methyltransferase [Elusimicrobiota bacterium]